MTPATLSRLWWLLAALALALLMVPLFLVELPPLLDTPNHLARQWFLAKGTHDPILSRFYAAHWAVIPNMAVDLLMIALQRFMPLYTAGKVVIALTLLVQFAGIAVYSRALFKRFPFWALGAAVFGYNALLLLGFLSFLLGTGLAFMAAAAWVTWRERRPIATTIGLAIAGLAIFFVHLLGVAFLGFLLACIELDHVLNTWPARGYPIRNAATRTLALAAVFLPSAVLYFTLVPPKQLSAAFYPSPGVSLGALPLAFASYDRLLDAVTIGSLMILLGLCIGWDKPGFKRSTVLQLSLFSALYFLIPFRLDDEAFLSIRMIFWAGLVVFAGLAPNIPRRFVPFVASGAALLFAARIVLVSLAWHESNAELAAFRQVIATVPAGAKVMAVTVSIRENEAYWAKVPRARLIAQQVPSNMHLPALLMIEHRAFWPMLFNVPSQHTIRVRPEYVPLSVPSAGLAPYQALTKPTPFDWFNAPYLRDWQDKFDYVLVMNAGAIRDLSKVAPGKLDLVTRADVAALFRVRPAKAQPLDATTSTRSSGPPSFAPPTAVTSIRLDETPRAIR